MRAEVDRNHEKWAIIFSFKNRRQDDNKMRSISIYMKWFCEKKNTTKCSHGKFLNCLNNFKMNVLVLNFCKLFLLHYCSYSRHENITHLQAFKVVFIVHIVWGNSKMWVELCRSVDYARVNDIIQTEWM